MSEKRTIYSRPRTRVYDCNYNIGEKCYKPMLDQLDRKYSAPFSTPSISSRLNDDVDFHRNARRTSPFGSDFNSIAGESSRRLNAETRSLEEDLEDDIVNSMRKLKVLRAAKAASVDEEPTFHSDIFNGTAKKRLNYTDKLLDSVGVNGKLQDSLEEEILKKRTVKLPSMFDDEPASFTKWTPLREPFNGDDSVRESAMHRARQSRARLADIEDEIDAVAQKSLAREKRLSNLKSLIANEDPFIDAADSFTSKSKKVSSSVKKVTF